MAYTPTGMQALFPVQLPRRIQKDERMEDYDATIAQGENNLNQNFSILYQKLMEMEEQLARL